MNENNEKNAAEKKISGKVKWSLIAGCGVLVIALGVFFVTDGFSRNVPVQEDAPVIEGEEAVDLTLEDITDSKGKGTVTDVDETIAKDPLKVDDAATGGKNTEDKEKADTGDSTTKQPAQPASNPSGEATQPSGGSTIIRTEGGFVEQTSDGHLHWGTDPGVSSSGTYSCGYPNHNCTSESMHISLLNAEAKGCRYCGAHDCPSIYSNEPSDCPMYDITRDGRYYCQVCGLPMGIGLDHCLHMNSGGFNCPHCGQYISGAGCHHCPGA